MKKLGVVSVLVFLMMFLGVSLLATVDMSAKGELTYADFSNLSYTDKKGDDYTFRMEGDVSGFEVEYEDSWGIKGKDPSYDIVSLKAILNGDIVTATMECAGNIDLDYESTYLIFFVKKSHNPRECPEFNKILNPEDYKESSIEFDFGDYYNSYLYIGYHSTTSDSYPESSSYTSSLEGSVSGKRMTLTISTEDLEDEGISSTSGFDIYGFAARIESGFEYYTYTWDSAGYGAVSSPDEFDSRELDPVAGAVCLILIIAGIIIIVVIIFYFAKKKKEKDRQGLQQYQQRQKQYLQQQKQYLQQQKQYLQQQQQYQQPQQQYQQPQQQYQHPQQQYQHPQTYQPPQQQYQQYSQQPAYQQISSAATQSTQYPCSYCRQPMIFYQQYQKWYCDYCRRYA